MIRALVALCIGMRAGAAAAQDWPAPRTAISTLAGVLDPAAEARIAAPIAAARADPGVEVTVVTIRSVADHAPRLTIEAFASGPFNA
ncbi:MAG: hypothetical protein ACK4TB_05720 [Gemmobacter sp.]